MEILLALACLFSLPNLAHAEEPAAYALPEIKVGGEAPDSAYLESLPSVTHLSGNELERKKQSTVGETLAREPGVSSTFFGPNASRPVIRGLDGDRIRIMENGTGTLDASSASPDHAVSVDPLVVESIDVIRGPSALLYGNTAVGGVVNIKTKRIASGMIDANELKLDGTLSSVDRGRAFGLMGREKLGHWVLEFDGSGRGTEDYAVPGMVRSSYLRAASPLAAGEVEETARVRNSSNRSYQAGLGATYVGSDGHAGLAVSALQSNYGTVAEKSVLIDLQRFRIDAEAEKHYTSSFIETARIKGAATVYRHQEIEDGETGTTFRNKGGELRADFKHQKIGDMEGTFGVQAQMFRFSALGEEAFLPSTLNQSYAAFAFEEWKFGNWKPSAGIRMDFSGVNADKDPVFGAAESRNFFTPNASLGLAYEFTPRTSLGLNLTYSERAPNYQELYADGAHLATGVYEKGNREINQERGMGAELFLRDKDDSNEVKAGVFIQSFTSFIALSPTGAMYTDPGSGELYPIDNFNSVSALLTGFEAQWTHEIPGSIWGGHLEGELQADFVRGLDRTHSGNLPRTPPFREGLTLNYRNQGYSGFVQFQRSEKQALLADNELPTDAYNLVHAGIEAPLATSFGDYRISFRVNNIFDSEARVHTSFLKDIAPLPGRNFVLGFQAAL